MLDRAMSSGAHGSGDERELAQLRALNGELRRLLEKHQWSGLTPSRSYGACPECGGSSNPEADGHRPGCAIANVLRGGQLNRPGGGAPATAAGAPPGTETAA